MALPVRVISVFNSNFTTEFGMICSLIHKYPLVCIDTEFPGVVFNGHKPYHKLNPQENFSITRENVNVLKLIQLGFTICDQMGNLPLCRDECNGDLFHCCWEFNFREFDADNDIQNIDSVNLLKKEGIDFSKNSNEGISTAEFANAFLLSELGFSFRSFVGCPNEVDPNPNLTWIFFHSTYDVGYLIKLLTQKPLPANHVTFMGLVRMYLGRAVYDLKELIKVEPYGWNSCGLNKLAENLNVKRIAGKSHQAGSDSLLTMHCFMAFAKLIQTSSGKNKSAYMWDIFKHKLHGLEVDQLMVQEELKLMKKYYQSAMFHSYGRRRPMPLLVRVPFWPMKTYSRVVVPVPIFRLSQPV